VVGVLSPVGIGLVVRPAVTLPVGHRKHLLYRVTLLSVSA
jgi:hypothetical protein